MNLVDVIVLILILLSAILGFTRGLVREILGIGAWIGAALVAITCFQLVKPIARSLIVNQNIADPVAFGVLFLVTLIVLSIISQLFSRMVRGSLLSGVDRILGICFGVVRAFALLIVAYIVGGLLVTSDHWSDQIRNARSLPYIYQGAVWAVQLVPPQMRPRLQTPPDATASPVQPTAPQE